MRTLKMMIACLLAVMMLLSMVACGSDNTPDATTTTTENTNSTDGGNTADPTTEDSTPSDGGDTTEPKQFEVITVTSGDFEISVLGAEKVAGLQDSIGLRIYYQYTNNSAFTVKALEEFSLDASQNGEEIGTVVPMESVPEDDCNDLYVRPGVTIRCTSVRELVDETSPVTFSIGDYSAEEKLEVEFDLANLPGAPTEALEIAAVADPQNAGYTASEGTLDEKYAVKILGVEKSTDKKDNPILVVHYSFTNNSDEDKSFTAAVGAKVFQDGIQLKTATPADTSSPAYKARMDKCPAGQTLEVDMCYKLLSDSPCEVEVCDKHISQDSGDYFEELIGLIFPVA